MSLVSLISRPSYDVAEVETAVRRAVDLVGGMSSFVRPGQKVLLKPNMLSAHEPERCITTHPAVVEAVGRMVIEAGGEPFIADSPALDRFSRVARKSGLAETAERLGIDIFELDRPTRTAVPGEAVFKSIEVAAAALVADVVINLPKAKTHSQMVMTLGVKNLFGTVVAQRKAEWHYMAGVDRPTFASLLLDLYRTVNPALTVLDAVWGMEGRGPANGRPRQLNLIAASADALALDLAACRLWGAPWKKLPLYRAAAARGLIPPGGPDIALVGDPPESLRVDNFDFPKLEAVGPGGRYFGAFSRRYLVSKPTQEPEACAACQKCVTICPADALELRDRTLSFDYDRCIRCYCCQEVCPEDAIGFRRGWLVRLLNGLGR